MPDILRAQKFPLWKVQCCALPKRTHLPTKVARDQWQRMTDVEGQEHWCNYCLRMWRKAGKTKYQQERNESPEAHWNRLDSRQLGRYLITIYEHYPEFQPKQRRLEMDINEPSKRPYPKSPAKHYHGFRVIKDFSWMTDVGIVGDWSEDDQRSNDDVE